MNEVDEEEELLSRRQSLKDLTLSAGWGILVDLANEQIEHRKTQELAFDIEGPEALFELAKLKAERRALTLFINLPEVMIENITQDLEEDFEDATENHDSSS